MNLYMMHVGFYDHSIGEGIYESHINYFIAASDPKDAKTKVLALEEFQDRNMHIDGIKELDSVNGYKIILEKKHNNNHDVDSKYSYDDVKKI